MSGTSEMALAGLIKNKIFNENELPLKYYKILNLDNRNIYVNYYLIIEKKIE